MRENTTNLTEEMKCKRCVNIVQKSNSTGNIITYCGIRNENCNPDDTCSMFKFDEKKKDWDATEDRQLHNIAELLKNPFTKQEGIALLANHCRSRMSFITLGKNMYVYNDGVYIPNGKEILSQYCESHFPSFMTNHTINEVVGHIERATFMTQATEEQDKICLKNGVLDFNTNQILTHSPKLIFFNKLPVEFDANADCPRIKQFLSEVVSTEDMNTLQELFGHCLEKNIRFHKTFMFVGGGSNGKSVLIKVVIAFLGSENCSCNALQTFEKNTFATSSLFGKLANLSADISNTALKETGIFKMLTGDDAIQAEKKFKDSFSFYNYAKLIFSCNELPRSPDDTEAFFRRWVIIPFPNKFIMGQNADECLIEKLTTKEELSGLLNFALIGRKRLHEQHHFTFNKSTEQAREDYIRLSDSVAAFRMDELEIGPEDFLEKKPLFSAYTEYCKKMKYPIVSQDAFFKRLPLHIRVEDYKPLEQGRRITCWKGIRYSKQVINETPVKRVHPNPILSAYISEGKKSMEKGLDSFDRPDNE